MNGSGRRLVVWMLGMVMLLLAGCAVAPPRNIENACSIFDEKSDWYKIMQDNHKKWGVPVHVQLAIIHQESKFTHDARPPRGKLFWFIPWSRASSAYGYAQVLDGTWNWYKSKTGNWRADRDNYKDAVDFIGWYVNISHRVLGISKWDAESQYLAYHEGHGGYKRKSYRKKKWLMEVARKVKRLSGRYRSQLAHCKDRLERGSGGWFF
ncbi:MAG: transglycosylase SLT domain-containing protein [Magnetococcales bacterium]|nr:transglycosylase SLT domain-containing protein [Magnetococcales bacterium]